MVTRPAMGTQPVASRNDQQPLFLGFGSRNPHNDREWLCPYKLKPAKERFLQNPACPLGCTRAFTAAENFIHHLRTTHSLLCLRGHRDIGRLTLLRRYLRDLGYWYCSEHKNFMPTIRQPGRRPDGMYGLRYYDCEQCGAEATPAYPRPLLRYLNRSPRTRAGPVNSRSGITTRPQPRPPTDASEVNPDSATGFNGDTDATVDAAVRVTAGPIISNPSSNFQNEEVAAFNQNPNSNSGCNDNGQSTRDLNLNETHHPNGITPSEIPSDTVGAQQHSPSAQHMDAAHQTHANEIVAVSDELPPSPPENIANHRTSPARAARNDLQPPNQLECQQDCDPQPSQPHGNNQLPDTCRALPPAHVQPETLQLPPPLGEVCMTPVPIIKHIPTRIRRDVCDALRAAIWEVVRARGNENRSRAFNILCLFPAAVLSIPPSRTARESSVSCISIFRSRLEAWKQRKYHLLWQDACRAKRTPPVYTSSMQEQTRRNQSRCIRLAKEGAPGKAVQSLQSNGIATLTQQVTSELIEKHPQQVREARTTANTRDQDHEFLCNPITPLEVNKAIKAFPAASAAGGSGLSPAHLQELITVPAPDDEFNLANAIARLATLFAQGKMPNELAPWFAGAALTPLRKRDNGIRPVAVGETLRRMISSILMKRVAAAAQEVLEPLQVGVCSKGGGEAIIHAVRRLITDFEGQADMGLLQVDLKNAFNLVDRSSFMTPVQGKFPELFPWVRYCYSNEPPYLWVGKEKLRSRTGVQQGDPLGPLLFALALHTPLAKLRERLHTNHPSETHLLSFYLDDGFIIGSHDTLRDALKELDSQDFKVHGLHLSVPKCQVWWPSEPPSDMRSKYPPELKQSYCAGTTVLRTPVGNSDFVQESMMATVQDLDPILKSLESLEDAHVALTLLRSCASTCKLVHLLRTVPPEDCIEAAKRYDQMVGECLRQIVGGVLPEETIRELRLPLNSEKPTFGIGLTSAVSIASSAFISSHILIQDLLTKLVTMPSVPEYAQDESIIRAHLDWKSRVHDAPTPKSLFEERKSQKWLSGQVHLRTIDEVTKGNERTQAFRSSLGLRGSKDWLKCQPSTGLRTYISDRDFRVWLKFYCRIPIIPENTTCPRRKCTAPLDRYGDHLLFCQSGLQFNACPRNWRHDCQVRLIATELCKAARRPMVEPHHEQHCSRPDIKAMGTAGGTDYLDVTIAHPLSSAQRITSLINNPSGLLVNACTAKLRIHAEFIRRAGTSSRLLPVALTTLGGWHHTAHRFLQTVADDHASRSCLSRGFARATLFRRHAAMLVRDNVRCLLDGFPADL